MAVSLTWCCCSVALSAVLQLNFIKTFVAPTFRALWTVAPLSAALGLAGCFINGCMCWLTIMWQTAGQKVMDVCGMGKLQRLL
jgi:hypothetical protein